MSLPYSFIGAGSYVNGASLATIMVPVTAKPDWFYVKDITNWGAATTAVNPLYAEWYDDMAAGSYLAQGQISADAGANYLYGSQGSTGGFTFIDTANPPTYPAGAITAIDDSSFEVSIDPTALYSVGDWVRILNPTGMLQFSSLVAQITAVSTNSYVTLGYVASAVGAGLTVAADATGGSIQKIYRSGFYPKEQQVLYVTQAPQAVVYFAGPNDFTPGQFVDFSIPAPFGMTQLSFLAKNQGPARVLSVTNSATVSSITLDLDTSGFTAFVYPSSANFALGPSIPSCVPAGAGVLPYNGSADVPDSPPRINIKSTFDNQNRYYMQIGTSACGKASATMEYRAFKADWKNITSA